MEPEDFRAQGKLLPGLQWGTETVKGMASWSGTQLYWRNAETGMGGEKA